MAVTNTVFDQIWQNARSLGVRAGGKSVQSIDWLLAQARALNVSPTMSDNRLGRPQAVSVIGSMYLYQYDPKTKQTLPYYDTFPLVFPINRYPDGFLGINLHYLAPAQRVKLLNALTDAMDKGGANSLQLSYNVLKGFSQLKSWEPCLKRYLRSHVRSRFIQIPRKDWEMAVVLPLARFQKMDQRQVWQNSNKQFRASRPRKAARPPAIRG